MGELPDCKSCDPRWSLPARHMAYPKLRDGGYATEPWPLCSSHMPFALVAGWKVEECCPLTISEGAG